MIFSLAKILLFVAIVAALALGVEWLMQIEGGAVITIAGQEFNPSILHLVIGGVILVLAVWLMIKLVGLLIALFKFLNGDETAISHYFRRNRERKGYEALSEGLMALASGEGRLAMAKASRAEKFLERPELTNLITAQAAEMAGDRQKAEETYKRLLQDDSTRFVGVRGIMKQKLADGDTDTALALAEKAFALKPKHIETQDVLLKLQAEKEDWKGARETLNAKLKSGSLPRDVHRRRDAVLALSEARDVMDDGSDIEAREAAIEANRLSPDFIPAAVMAAEGYMAQEKPHYATRVIKKTWDAKPHPDLAAAYAAIVPDETPVARLKRFRTLVKATVDHSESKMVMAELNIAAEDFPQARRALGELPVAEPTARSLAIMAAIERGEGADDAVVRGWLTRALTAPRGPQWICENCSNIHRHWTPTCDNCGSFDTLSWKTPPTGEIAMPDSTEMLPLITGPTSQSEVEEVLVVEDQSLEVVADIIEEAQVTEEK